MSRRSSPRFNRGRVGRAQIAAAPPSAAPPSVIIFNQLVTSVTVLQAVQSDLGITLNGGTVSAWADQSGNAKDYSQGTAANQPTFNSSDLNGFPSLTFDGTNDVLDSSLTLPAPGTTPSWCWCVIQQVAWTLNHYFFSSTASESHSVLQRTATPGIGGYDGTFGSANNGGTVGSWARGQILWNNNTTDYVKFGSAAATTGTNLGNATFAGRRIGASPVPSLWGSFKIVALMYCAGEPNSSEKSALDAAVTSKYGAGVLL